MHSMRIFSLQRPKVPDWSLAHFFTASTGVARHVKDMSGLSELPQIKLKDPDATENRPAYCVSMFCAVLHVRL